MLAVAFDTLKLARKLESAGFPPKQAQEASAALAESLGEWHGNANLATEDSLQKTKVLLEVKLAETKADLEARMAQLETRLAETKADLIKWMFGISFAQAAMILGILKFHL